MLRILLVAFIALHCAAPVAARAGNDQELASIAVARGEILPLGDIIERVGPRIGGRLIGSSYDEEGRIYMLRFMRGNQVVSVVVDARTGRMLNGRQQF